MLQLKMVSDGTPAGTKLLDAATGEPFAAENARVVCHVKGQRGFGSAEVTLVIKNVHVEVAPDVKTPFEFIGHPG